MAILPIVTKKDEIAVHRFEQARLIGRYTQMDVRKLRDGAPVYIGHVAVVLDDNTQVLLYPVWHSAAQRSDEEIKQFKDRRVAVEGTVFATAPSSPDNYANLMMPCVMDVTSISLVPEDWSGE